MGRLQHMFSGRELDIFNITAADILITDIAHTLAMQCRFGGNTKYHYSVAQHCVYVAERMWDLTHDYTPTLVALLHDASEAYLLDLPRPIKLLRVCEFYRTQERIVQRIILERFGLPTSEMSPQLVALDNAMLVMECQQLFDPGWTPSSYVTLPEHDDWRIQIEPWTPEHAKERFIDCFNACHLLEIET